MQVARYDEFSDVVREDIFKKNIHLFGIYLDFFQFFLWGGGR